MILLEVYLERLIGLFVNVIEMFLGVFKIICSGVLFVNVIVCFVFLMLVDKVLLDVFFI